MRIRPVFALSSSALLLLSVGCENQNSLAAGGPCASAASSVTSQPIRPTAMSLWSRANQPNHAYTPNAPGLQSTAQAAVSIDALLEAMDVELDLIETKSITGDGSQSAVVGDMGALTPTEGSTMGWLSTGVAAAGTSQSADPSALGVQTGTDFYSLCPGADFDNLEFDCVTLTLGFEVPDGMHSVRFDFAFMSAEYPEFVGMGFNDEFSVSLHSATNNYDNIVFDDNGNMVNIDSAFFDEPCANLAGTGFDLDDGGGCDAGGTGLLSTIAPVEPGENVTLAFNLRDRGDGIYDSAIMVDNIAVRSTDVDEPETDPCE